MSDRLLTMDGVRVDVGGTPALDGLTVRTTADRVVVLGAARALFEAASGLRSVMRGTLCVRGLPPGERLRAGTLGAAPVDPPMPPRWSPRTYAAWSGRLAGLSKSAARAAAEGALERLGLGPAVSMALGSAPLPVRRAAVIAAALVTPCPIVFLEDPTGSLPDEAAHRLAQLVTAALDGRAWMVFAPRMHRASPFSLRADERIVVSGSEVVAQGAPAESAARARRFALRVHGDAEAFVQRATAHGAHVSQVGSQLVVDVTDAVAPRELFGFAAEARVVIVELAALPS